MKRIKKWERKVIDFGGWELPVQFSSILEEHEAVRTQAGLFDVSHMGKFIVEGKDAESFINTIVSNDVTKVEDQSSTILSNVLPRWWDVDDLIVYKLADEKYLFVPNAANIDKDYAWINEHLKGDVTLKNISDEVGLACDSRSKSRKLFYKN